MCATTKVGSTLSFFLAVLVSLSLANAVQAQSAASAPGFIRINEVQLHPTLTERFRAFHLYQVLPAQRASELPWRLTTEVIFGDSWKFFVITPLESYEDLDGGGAAQTELRDSLFATSVESRRSFILRSRPELGITGRDGVLPVNRVAKMRVQPGKIAEFERFWVNSMIPAMTRSGVTQYSVYQTTFGGSPNEFYGNMYFDTFADLDGFNLLGGLSATEQASLLASFGALADIVEITLSTVDGELSFGLPNLQP